MYTDNANDPDNNHIRRMSIFFKSKFHLDTLYHTFPEE